MSYIPSYIYNIQNRGYYKVYTQYKIVKEPFLNSELIKLKETYNAQIPININKIIPLSAVVKAHLTTSRPTSCGYK
jgi:hypothetical protein